MADEKWGRVNVYSMVYALVPIMEDITDNVADCSWRLGMGTIVLQATLVGGPS